MNIFEVVKEGTRCKDVAFRYLGQPKKITNGRYWYISPFRKEKAPSFIVDDKGVHDFGENWHGDSVALVCRLFHTTPKQAAQIIVNDFGLRYEENNYKSDYIIQLRKKELEEKKQAVEKLERWFNEVYIKLCDKFQELELCKSHLHKYPIAKCYVEIDLNRIEYIIDTFINAKTTEDKLELYKNREEIEKWIA